MTKRPSKQDEALNGLLRRALDYEIDEARLTRAILSRRATSPRTPLLSLGAVMDRRPVAFGTACVALSFLAGMAFAPASTSSSDAMTVALALGDMAALLETGFPASSRRPEAW